MLLPRRRGLPDDRRGRRRRGPGGALHAPQERIGLPHPGDRLLPSGRRDHGARPRRDRLLREALSEALARARRPPPRLPAHLRLLPSLDAALARRPSDLAARAQVRARLHRSGLFRQAPPRPRRLGLPALRLRGGGDPHRRLRRGMGDRDARPRRRREGDRRVGAGLPRLARPALFGGDRLPRLRGQRGRGHGHGPGRLRTPGLPPEAARDRRGARGRHLRPRPVLLRFLRRRVDALPPLHRRLRAGARSRRRVDRPRPGPGGEPPGADRGHPAAPGARPARADQVREPVPGRRGLPQLLGQPEIARGLRLQADLHPAIVGG